jgi:hypothetical protein
MMTSSFNDILVLKGSVCSIHVWQQRKIGVEVLREGPV